MRLTLLLTSLTLLPTLSLAETVARGVIMDGTRYATPYYVRTGDARGPSVVVVGGVHGNEPAGYLAARKLANWKVTAGTLTVLPEAHKEAIRRNVRAYPGNMNAMFPGKRDGDDMQRLAYGIWRMIYDAKPDLLVTLHESVGLHRDDPTRFGQSFTYDFAEETPYMQRVADRVNARIATPRDRFTLFVAPYKTCPTYVTAKLLGIPATSIETWRGLPLQTRVRYQLVALEAFLDEVGLGYEQGDVGRLG